MPRLAVVVPAGGRGRRLSQDKLTADVAGRALLDRTLDGLPADAVIVCVGPEIQTRRLVRWVRESPPYAGPLAAIEAGVDSLSPPVEVVVLIGGDMPWAQQAVPALVTALHTDQSAGCAVVMDRNGRLQPLLSAWRLPSLVAALEDQVPTAGRALAGLLDSAQSVVVHDVWSASADVDTPEDLAEARASFEPPLA